MHIHYLYCMCIYIDYTLNRFCIISSDQSNIIDFRIRNNNYLNIRILEITSERASVVSGSVVDDSERSSTSLRRLRNTEKVDMHQPGQRVGHVSLCNPEFEYIRYQAGKKNNM